MQYSPNLWGSIVAAPRLRSTRAMAKPGATARHDRAKAHGCHVAASPHGVTSEHILFLLREELIEPLLARDPLLGELVVG